MVAFFIGVVLAVFYVGFADKRGPYTRVIVSWLDVNLWCSKEAKTR